MSKYPGITACCMLASSAALAQSVPSQVPAPSQDAATKVETIQVTTRRLDAARNSLSPDTGSSVYRFDAQDIEALPLGSATPLNELILRAPGVVQDSFGQLHVRGDHANLQYRINGIVIPEPIAGFGQAFDSRFADRVSFITGALPAQYGYRTAGVVDIQAKTDASYGGSLAYLGGSRRHEEGSAELHGGGERFSFYVTGSALTNDLGIENPTPERNAIHDQTRQQKAFGVLSYVVDPDSRVSFVFGRYDGRFQIPDTPGVLPDFTLAGSPPPDSRGLDARQHEKNRFEVLSYQRSAGAGIDYQLSLFHRDTDVHYQPDPVGDLVYNGIAADIRRRNEAVGLQGDLSWRIGERHTMRSGVFASRERFSTTNAATVFPADADGNQASDVPVAIFDASRITGRTGGIYLQDEWRPSRAITVNIGARYDRVDTVVDESQLSPRVGVTWDVSPKTRVHAGYARYFTPPPTEKIDTTSVVAFLGTTNALPSDANTAVKSERAHYFDAGLSHQLTSTITLGVDAYVKEIRHLQDEGQFGNALIFSAFNYERGRISGLELSATYRAAALSAYGNVAISRAMGKGIETGQFNFDQDELDYVSGHWVHLDHDQSIAASAGMSYRWGSATATVDALYGSGLRRGFANSEHLPSYTQVNMGVVHSFKLPTGGSFDTRLAVLNVFDRSFALRDGSGIGVGAPQFGPRRTILAGVTMRF